MFRFGRRGLIIEWNEAKAVTYGHLKYVIYLRFSFCERESALFNRFKIVVLFISLCYCDEEGLKGNETATAT